MKERVERQLKKAKIFKYIIFGALGLSLLSIMILPQVNTGMQIYAPIVMLSTLFFMICGFIYLINYLPVTSAAKWLKKIHMENAIDDISENAQPTLPKSLIFCGKKAIYSEKPFVIIPYSEIAWIYVSENSAYGIAVRKDINICMRDGKHFMLRANITEFQWLLSNYRQIFPPYTLIGYGDEQKRAYSEIIKKYCSK